MQNIKPPAPFVTGSIFAHVTKTTLAGTLGLIAIFLVDFLNLYYISLLGKIELTVAIGFASLILYIFTSLAVGLMIAGGALVSRAIGKGDRAEAGRFINAANIMSFGFGLVISVLLIPTISPFLTLMGAVGEAHSQALRFLYIVLPFTFMLTLGIQLSGLLRAIGLVKASTYVTLVAAIAAVVLDPLFIFVFNMGLDGAALASILARIFMLLVGFYYLQGAGYHFKFDKTTLLADFRALNKIAFPAILTNIATPVGVTIATAFFARVGGLEIVAAWTVINRIVPIAFAGLFTLSGAVGPIIGQNLGAKQLPRVKETINAALKFILLYGAVVYVLLYFIAQPLCRAMGVTGQAASFIIYFCQIISLLFVFNGVQYVANAAFNNLSFPHISTITNWSRTLFGTWPFLALGAALASSFNTTPAYGALMSYGIGGVIFALGAIFWCYRVIGKLKV
jgi:putative MATE family efflux protein